MSQGSTKNADCTSFDQNAAGPDLEMMTILQETPDFDTGSGFIR
jgi:hypothetical protein